jgi:hypothetical protein
MPGNAARAGAAEYEQAWSHPGQRAALRGKGFAGTANAGMSWWNYACMWRILWYAVFSTLLSSISIIQNR